MTQGYVSNGGQRILAVDDDPVMQSVLTRWLTAAQFEVETVGTVAECRTALRQQLPHAVLLDFVLPDGDGLSLLDEIRTRYPTLPVVLLTGNGSIESAVAAVQKGAWDYLTKPVDRHRLATCLRNAVGAREMAERLETLAADAVPPVVGLVGRSAIMDALRKDIHRVAGARAGVLITGETGSGKEVVARAIHALSPRARAPFVAINCAALPDGLQDAEFFGHERHAFTGAIDRRVGRIEQADGGTLFLDEVAELSASAQAKLLRVLQERSFYRIGGTREIAVDFRLICATHRSIREEMAAGTFREDLYYRINVAQLHVPPLRAHMEDLPELVHHILPRLVEPGQAVPEVTPAAMSVLNKWEWPGNVRELQSVLHRAMLASSGDVIDRTDVAKAFVEPEGTLRPVQVAVTTTAAGTAPAATVTADAESADDAAGKLAELEQRAILGAIRRHKGNLSAARRELGIGKTTLYRKLLSYGLRAEDLRASQWASL